MTRLQFVTADVFTRVRFGGNPVAVLPECPPLADDLLQAIARELNLSETVFVEDPATGSAAAALARFLAEVQRPQEPSRGWTIHQGAEMGRPSLLELRAAFAGVTLAKVEVGGGAVLQSEGRFWPL